MFMDFKPTTISTPAQDMYYTDAAKLIKAASTMTEEEIQLLVKVAILTADRPDLREYALNWKGDMQDLPAALAKI